MAILAAMSFSFVSCGDDDGPDASNPTGSGCQNANEAIINFNGKFLTSIIDGKYVERIEYDSKGRVSEITNSFDDGDVSSVFKIDYDNCSFTSEYKDPIYPKGAISFNNDGYISKISCYKNYKEEGYISDNELNITMTYNSSGHLTELIYTEEWIDQDLEEKEEDIEIYTCNYKFTWENGNLTNVKENVKWKENGRVTENYMEEYVITYSSVNNVFQQIPFLIYDWIDDNWDWGAAGNIFAAIGLLGKGTTNLPKTLVYRTENNYNYDDVFKYELNSNGSIAKENGIIYGYGDDSTKFLSPVSSGTPAKGIKKKNNKREKRKSLYRRERK